MFILFFCTFSRLGIVRTSSVLPSADRKVAFPSGIFQRSRVAACEGSARLQGAAGLRRRRLRPARPFSRPSFPRAKPAAERMGLHERTCGTRIAALRRGGGCGLLRPFGRNSEFKIQDSKLLLGLQPAEGRHEQTRVAGLRRPQAAARTVLADRFCRQAPQPRRQPRRQPQAAARCSSTRDRQFRLQDDPPYRPPQPGPLRQKKGAPPARGSAPFSASSEAKPAAATTGACRARSSSRPPGCRTPADPYRPG